MTYLLIAIVLVPVAALVATLLYLEHQNKKRDREETLRFRAMTSVERADALVNAKRARALAREERGRMSRLFYSYKWGYRHNPYRFRYAAAQGAYAAAQARVGKLESIIAELDEKSS